MTTHTPDQRSAAEAARAFMARVVALDWSRSGDAEQSLEAIILQREKAAREEERAECAKAARNFRSMQPNTVDHVVSAIRARGESSHD